MSQLRTILDSHKITANELRETLIQRNGRPMSKAAMSRLINHGDFPADTAREKIETQIQQFFIDRDIPVDFKGLLPGATDSSNNTPEQSGQSINQRIVTMLPQAQLINQPARRKFGLTLNPFEGFPQTESDYFLTDAMYSALESFHEAAQLGVVRAVVGESGSGKTTLKKLFRMRMGQSITLVDVLVTTMSDSEKRGGRVMPSTQIHTAIIRAIAGDDAKIPADADARQKRSRKLLQNSAETGKRTVLFIDEGHDLPIATLAHLKRFNEFAEGALGIIVTGQPGLQRKLTPRLSPEIKEAGQRFPVEILPPLDEAEIKAYLDKRLARAAQSFGGVFESDAPAAIAYHLRRSIQEGRGAATIISEAYPLSVGNLAAAAINRAAALGFDRVSGELISAAAREV